MTWNPAVHELTFLCSHCGWHPDNSARWCGSGCGSDYNRMIPTERAEALYAAAVKVHELERWHRDSLRHRARAEDRVRELEAERQAILDCINLYGDENLHSALDVAGLLLDGRVG